MDYTPIDYSKWDMSGQGKNILPLLNESEKEIWRLALPYQDKRQDAGHGEVVTYFGLILLPYYPEADRKIFSVKSLKNNVQKIVILKLNYHTK